MRRLTTDERGNQAWVEDDCRGVMNGRIVVDGNGSVSVGLEGGLGECVKPIPASIKMLRDYVEDGSCEHNEGYTRT